MKISTVFVVYDPTRERQPALERAATIASETCARVHLFCCIHDDSVDSKSRPEATRQMLSKQQGILEQALRPLIEEGIDATSELEWDSDWYEAVVRASISSHADLVLKSSYKHTAGQRILRKTSDWTLIRGCHCPVLLVREGSPKEIRKVLAAIDIQARDDSHTRLNQQIIEFGRRVLDRGVAEVHFVNAFGDIKAFPDRNALIEASGADNDRIHVRMGDPEDVIVSSAREVGASLVVVGNSARSGLSAIIQGNTAEKVLDQLDCDLLAMP